MKESNFEINEIEEGKEARKEGKRASIKQAMT